MTLDGAGGSPAPGRHALDWEQVYREHGPRLRRLIARRAPSAAVDDILQDTFVRAYRSRERLDTSRPLWPFLATLADRSCIQWYRAQQAPGPAAAAPERALGDFPGSDEHLAAYVRSRRVAEALARLTPRHRRILYLHGINDYACDVIAAGDRLSEKAVRSALDRARANFRSRYDARSVVLGLGRHWWVRVRHRAECMRWDACDRLGLLAAGAAVTVVVGVLAAAPDAPPSVARAAAPPAPSPRVPPPESPANELGRAAPTTARPADLVRTTGARPHASVAGGVVDRPGLAAPPPSLAVRTAGGLVNMPGESTVATSIEIVMPVTGWTVTKGSTVYCDRGRVATLECTVLRLLPLPD